MTRNAVPDILRIAIAQLNPTVGDVAGNLARALTSFCSPSFSSPVIRRKTSS